MDRLPEINGHLSQSGRSFQPKWMGLGKMDGHLYESRQKITFENFPVELFRIYKIKPWSILFNSKWNICSKMISQIWIWVGVICNKWGNIKSFFSWKIFFSKLKNWRFRQKMFLLGIFIRKLWPFSKLWATQKHNFWYFFAETPFLSFFLIETTHI